MNETADEQSLAHHYLQTIERIYSRSVHDFYEEDLKRFIQSINTEQRTAVTKVLTTLSTTLDPGSERQLLVQFAIGCLHLSLNAVLMIESFTSLIQQTKSRPYNEIHRKLLALCFHFRARGHMDVDDHKGAIDDFQSALQYDKNYASAYNNCGLIYHLQDRTDDAIKMYTQAITLCPTYGSSYYNRGNSYYHMRKYEEAIRNYRLAEKNDPDLLSSYYNESLAHRALGRFTCALHRISLCTMIGDRVDSLRADYRISVFRASSDPLFDDDFDV